MASPFYSGRALVTSAASAARFLGRSRRNSRVIIKIPADAFALVSAAAELRRVSLDDLIEEILAAPPDLDRVHEDRRANERLVYGARVARRKRMGAAVARWRVGIPLTQHALAARLGRKQWVIAAIESGHRLPTAEQLAELVAMGFTPPPPGEQVDHPGQPAPACPAIAGPPSSESALSAIATAYQRARDDADRTAAFRPDDVRPAHTCRFCGLHRTTFGSRLPGHARCVVPAWFMELVLATLERTPTLTMAALGKALGVGQPAIRGWYRRAIEARSEAVGARRAA